MNERHHLHHMMLWPNDQQKLVTESVKWPIATLPVSDLTNQILSENTHNLWAPYSLVKHSCDVRQISVHLSWRGWIENALVKTCDMLFDQSFAKIRLRFFG